MNFLTLFFRINYRKILTQSDNLIMSYTRFLFLVHAV